MELWEQILVGVFALVILFWLGPGAKRSLANSRSASAREWLGVLVPLALVVLFVVFLIANV